MALNTIEFIQALMNGTLKVDHDLPTEIGTQVYPHGDPAGTVIELTPAGWVNQRTGYRYNRPEISFGEYDVLRVGKG